MKTTKLFAIASLTLLIIVSTSCDNETLKGTLKIAITDAPIDAKNIKSVNIFFKNLEANQNGNWKSFKNYEQPIGVNLLSYTGGKSFLLIDQFTNPGEFQQLRMDLNIANRNSSLIINPQSNIEFTDGSTQPLYMKEGLEPKLVIDAKFGISSRGITDITLDVDLRKSIQINDTGEYVLNPVVRVINTFESGYIEAIVSNPIAETTTVFAYKEGTFKQSELQLNSGITFGNAITSNIIVNKKLQLGFLTPGPYDLIFVKSSTDGNPLEVMGMILVQVAKREVTTLELDLNLLSSS